MPSDPEVRAWGIDRARDTLLVLGSDGVWDVLSNEDACREAKRGGAKQVVGAAFALGSADNISAIVVELGASAARS